MRTHAFHIDDWRRPTWDRLYVLHTELVALVDPGFATWKSWPPAIEQLGPVGPPDDRSYVSSIRYANGDRAVVLDEQEWQGFAGVGQTETFGLPGGARLMLRAEVGSTGCDLTVTFELPDAVAAAVIARCR